MKKNILKKESNLKAKIISLIGAFLLWMYVIAVVDPEEKKVIEGVPITIINQAQIESDDFAIYPKEKLTTDVTVEGKLSEIQKINKNNVHVYGEVSNPVEGKNIITLRTNLSSRVSRELSDNTLVINLEKKMSKVVPVKIDIPDKIKNIVFSAEPVKNEVIVSGPRTLVNRVDHVGSTLKIDRDEISSENFEKNVELKAYDKNNEEVAVKITPAIMPLDIHPMSEKTVPLKINYTGNEYNSNNYTLNPQKVEVIGEAKTLKNLDNILTERLNDNDFENLTTKKVKLELPKDIRLKEENIEIDLSKK